jgi:hypothetical protein
MYVPFCQTGCFGFQLMQSVEICSTRPSSAKQDVSESETLGSRISESLDNLGKTTMAEPNDLGTPLVCYLENPGHIANRKVQ